MSKRPENTPVDPRQPGRDGLDWLDRELGIPRRSSSSSTGTDADARPAGADLRRVLIVDDEDVMVNILRGLLPGGRYIVNIASSGEEALEKLKAWKPDLVVLDFMLPGMDGVEVCRNIRETLSDHSIKIMMISGHSTLNDRVRGYGAGADDFLVKPIEPAVFCSKVDTLFEWARKDREKDTKTAKGRAAVGPKTNCWEYMKCGRDMARDCPAAASNQGRICWLVAGTMCGGQPQGTYAQKIKNCSLCDFYIALKEK